MKIAIMVGPSIAVPPIKYGGTEQVVYYIIKGLVEAGHQPLLFGPGDSTVDCEIVPTVEKALGFPQKRADLAAYNKQLSVIQKRTERKLLKYLPDIDIIHSHGFDLINFANFPNLFTMHNKIDFDELPYFLKRKNLYYASISRNQQEAYPDLNYVDVIYNGENPSNFPIIEKPENYLCFLGRFDRDKNPHLAIQLAINLKMKIKVAGKIDYKAEGYFQQEIAPLLKHHLVEYLGEIGFDEKIELLSKAKCNLHPTNFREPFGLTVLEAAYCGTPTLATTRGSMPELIEEERTGVLVEDFVEGAYQIQKCYEMDRNYIAERSRRLFNYQKMAESYVNSYQKVIEIYNEKSPNYKNQGLIKKLKIITKSIWS